MPTPILESIRQDLLTVLAGITTGAGFAQTLAVQSVARYGNTAGDLDTIVEQGKETILGEVDDIGSVGQDTYIQEFLIFVHIQNAEGAATDFDARANSIAADVRKAVMADVTRGGKAIRTEKFEAALFASSSPEAAGDVAGVMLPFKVHYRTRQDDPYNQ